MQVTIVYDNTAWDPRLAADWGFSCLVEAHGRKILFDTGAGSRILMENLRLLDISLSSIDAVFISHTHADHIGGLHGILKVRPDATVFFPDAPTGFGFKTTVSRPVEIFPGIFSTGLLAAIEQSLVVAVEGGVAVITGCSHPGVEAIVEAAGKFGKPRALIGGFHDFHRFEILESIDMVCPAHCTAYIGRIQTMYPEKVIPGGAGRIMRIP
jgi:7,8-dihydropterin-6-yl-methyl-4-(beta-D-ribofuranosyl)aminobenzene 5'-phosphate synthase